MKSARSETAERKETSLFDLSGRVALVTGASSGMGKSICEAMAEFGADVAQVDLVEPADNLDRFGHRSIFIQADAFDEAAIQRSVTTTVNELGAPDIVFAHAGIVDTSPAKIHEVSTEDWDRIAARYTRGIFTLMKSVFPLMMEKRKGNFITTSAGTALFPLPPVGNLHLATPYITAKASVIMLTKLAAKQYGEYGIRANVICPGYHRSLHHVEGVDSMPDMEQFILGMTPLKRVGLPEDIKGLAVYLASDASSFVTGQVFVEDGGFMA